MAGHQGMVGSAICRALARSPDPGQQIIVASRAELDLCDQAAVDKFFQLQKPDVVYLAAAKVGGILANQSFPADFISQNLSIQLNVIDAAFRHGVRKLLFLGSSCIYPKFSPTPIREEQLLTGELEPTNLPYAIAKIAGIKLCESYNRQYGHLDYRCIMPCNLYGPGDNYDPNGSHVLPALIRRFHEAKQEGIDEVVVWGTGKPRREFLHVDDLANACVTLMGIDRDRYAAVTSGGIGFLNAGSGLEISIASLAELVAEVVGFKGRLTFDDTKPDGVFSKLVDSSRLRALGWQPDIRLRDGIAMAYQDFLGVQVNNHS